MSDCTQAVPYITSDWVADTVLCTISTDDTVLSVYQSVKHGNTGMVLILSLSLSLCTHSHTTNVITHTNKHTKLFQSLCLSKPSTLRCKCMVTYYGIFSVPAMSSFRSAVVMAMTMKHCSAVLLYNSWPWTQNGMDLAAS